MTGTSRILGLIPARGGSKGLPGKNVLDLSGRPLIAWTIAAALDSDVLDTVVVSTDDLTIAAASIDAGADVPFMRPSPLACDDASMVDTVLHAVDSLAGEGRVYDAVMVLQATSPLRSAQDLRDAENLFDPTGGVDSVVSVVQTAHSPLWANTLPEDRRMCDFMRPEVLGKRRQDLPTYYRLNGAIYLITVEALRRQRTFIGQHTVALVMPADRSVDIDTIIDFEVARALVAHSGRK